MRERRGEVFSLTSRSSAKAEVSLTLLHYDEIIESAVLY